MNARKYQQIANFSLCLMLLSVVQATFASQGPEKESMTFNSTGKTLTTLPIDKDCAFACAQGCCSSCSLAGLGYLLGGQLNPYTDYPVTNAVASIGLLGAVSSLVFIQLDQLEKAKKKQN